MKFQQLGDGEYHLMKEEYLRESLPSDLGIALNDKSGRREPAIVFRQPLKDKGSLMFRDVESSWAVARNHSKVEIIFLTINFKAEDGKRPERIKVCFDRFTPQVKDWFKLLVDTGGRLVLNDRRRAGNYGHRHPVRLAACNAGADYLMSNFFFNIALTYLLKQNPSVFIFSLIFFNTIQSRVM